MTRIVRVKKREAKMTSTIPTHDHIATLSITALYALHDEVMTMLEQTSRDSAERATLIAALARIDQRIHALELATAKKRQRPINPFRP